MQFRSSDLQGIRYFNTCTIAPIKISEKVQGRNTYLQQVPAEISHADFWKRYFYKVHQLQVDEARKLALMKRAEQAQNREDSVGWEGKEDAF